ncbi:hypothetical protein LCY76_07865 [Fictibacillus sp. KIGAM418]|uniref:Uncharacterized protein n=1 Tax=Fictibacillus marinisediminis TaxID=2878389 RepID=A0A9X1X9I4_9BACL|nr:hypothetical protein [Fictibacillus marinisediminis]MCK6256506.1 hypothetical protein [Fictibacillus marinisediminis]
MHQAVYVKEAFTLLDKINKHLVKKLHTIVTEDKNDQEYTIKDSDLEK